MFKSILSYDWRCVRKTKLTIFTIEHLCLRIILKNCQRENNVQFCTSMRLKNWFERCKHEVWFIFNFPVWTECPLGKWGRDCEIDCKCQNGATCDPFDGKCMCTRGWTGVYCDQKCLSNRYGQDCAEECRCRNGGRCHHISGECHCASGYTGPL